MRTRSNVLAGFAATCAIALFCAGCKKDAPRSGDPEVAAVKVSLEAIDRFHRDLASGNTAEICRSAKPEAFNQVGTGGCEQYFARIHEKLGPFVSAKRGQLPIASNHPARVGVEYDVAFKNGSGREHFEFMFSEGQPQLTSYRIKSEQLP
jgi:hypothetical protein